MKPNPIENETTRVLIICDNDTHGQLLAEILSSDHFSSAFTLVGENAVDVFQSYQPDVVILDASERTEVSYQISRQIRDLNPDTFVPIIFISTTASQEAMSACLEYGGVDCLIKPYDPTVLSLKVKIYREISQLHQTVREQRDKMINHSRLLESSHALAEKVFNKVMQSDVLKSEGIKYILSPSAIFNGDLLLAAYRPSGELQVMLGDFTGHGLSAAIGAIPVSDIFYGMTEKGFSVSEIIAEINSKLLKILPRGLFLASAFIEYSRDSRKMSMWNAGMPDVFVYDGNGNIKLRMPSQHFPLGINTELSLGQAMEVIQIDVGDHLLMMTDGVVEAKNSMLQQYGIERISQVIASNKSNWKIDNIYANLSLFVGNNLIEDDTTLVEISLEDMTKPIEARKVQAYPTPVQNAEWKMNYVFGPEILRQVDPLPNIVTTLMELQKLHRYKQDIFVIIKELFVNAVDHGLLGLDSAIKSGPTGFSDYSNERQKRLGELEQGVVSLEFIHHVHPEGGMLDVYIYDSGNGFDVGAVHGKPIQDSEVYHGRGLLLVKSICQSLEFNEKGNEVHARYVWRGE